MTNNIRFITSAYGNRYFKYLLACLYSISKSNPQSKVSIFYQDIDEDKIKTLKKIYFSYEFIKTNVYFGGNMRQRIPKKLELWNYGCKKYNENSLCFIDTDMLVIKNLSKFFLEDFDIIFTHKNEKFPLNTGTMLIRNSKKIQNFFNYWKNKTLEITNNPKLLTLADKKSGAADQQSLRDILDSDDNFNRKIIRIINNEKIVFLGLSCEILNETRSTKITEKTHIIHYKGGWHPILLDGSGFHKNRPKKESLEMFNYFNDVLNKAKKQYEKIQNS